MKVIDSLGIMVIMSIIISGKLLYLDGIFKTLDLTYLIEVYLQLAIDERYYNI